MLTTNYVIFTQYFEQFILMNYHVHYFTYPCVTHSRYTKIIHDAMLYLRILLGSEKLFHTKRENGDWPSNRLKALNAPTTCFAGTTTIFTHSSHRLSVVDFYLSLLLVWVTASWKRTYMYCHVYILNKAHISNANIKLTINIIASNII